MSRATAYAFDGLDDEEEEDETPLIRLRSTLPPSSTLDLMQATTAAAEIKQAARRAAQQEGRQRAQKKREEEACPSLAAAMRTLATPFDAKQAAAALQATQQQPLTRRARHTLPDTTDQPPESKEPPASNSAGEALRKLFEKKERELGGNDSSKSDSTAAHHTTAAAASAATSVAADTSFAPELNRAGSSGVSSLRSELRNRMRETQARRDYELDATLGPTTAAVASRPAVGHARVELDDLIDIERKLDAEFGSIVSGAMRAGADTPPATKPQQQQPHQPQYPRPPAAPLYVRSQPGSKQASRRNSLTELAAGLGFHVLPLPADAAPATSSAVSASLGSQLRASREMREANVRTGLLRQRSAESGGVRGATVAAMATTATTTQAKPSSATQTPTARNVRRLSQPSVPVAATASEDAPEDKNRGVKDIMGGKFLIRPSTAATTLGPSVTPPVASAGSTPAVPATRKQPPPPSTHHYALPIRAAPSIDPALSAAIRSAPGSTARPKSASAAFAVSTKSTVSATMKLKPAYCFTDNLHAAAIKAVNADPVRVEESVIDGNDSEEEAEAAALADAAIQEEAARRQAQYHAVVSGASSAAASRASRRQTAPLGQPFSFVRGSQHGMVASPDKQMRKISASATPASDPEVPSSHNGKSSPFISPHPPARSAGASAAQGRKRMSAGLPSSSSSSSATPAASSIHGLRPTPPPHPQSAVAPTRSLASSSSSSPASSGDLLSTAATAAATAVSVGIASKGSKVSLAPLLDQPIAQLEDESEEGHASHSQTDQTESKTQQTNGAADEEKPAVDLTPSVRSLLKMQAASPQGSRPRSSHHVHATNFASDTADVATSEVPLAASTTSTAPSAVAASVSSASSSSSSSTRGVSSASISSSLSSQKYGTLVGELVDASVVSLDQAVKSLAMEHNRLHWAGDAKAQTLVTLSHDLTSRDDAAQREREEREQGEKQVAAKEAELNDLTRQHDTVTQENANTERDLRDMRKRHLTEERSLLDHRALSAQLDRALVPAQKKLTDTRAEIAALQAESARLREAFDIRARKYAADLAVQKRHVETLEMLARARIVALTPLRDGHLASDSSSELAEDAASSSASRPIAPRVFSAPAASLTHEQLLWNSRMEFIEAQTGLNDFLAVVTQMQAQPGARSKAEREQARLQTRVARLRGEQASLAKLLGMKRMAAVNAAAVRQSTAPSPIPLDSAALDDLAQRALDRLAALTVRLSPSMPAAPSSISLDDRCRTMLDRAQLAAACALQRTHAVA